MSEALLERRTDLFGVELPTPRAPRQRDDLLARSADPFFITGPAVLSISGGRTSARMLRLVLDAHGGTLPDDVVCAFANTGREDEATLRFVHELSARWGVRIAWVEYRRADPTPDELAAWREGQRASLEGQLARATAPHRIAKIEHRLASIDKHPGAGRQWAEVVGYNSASRNGEPFEMMMAGRRMLPNPTMRFCTAELKVRTIKRWVRQELGWKRWTNVVGLRADEPVRLANAAADTKDAWTRVHPLAEAGIAKIDVLRFWMGPNGRTKPQGFDLELPGEWAGNCDGCFMKGIGALLRMHQDSPERVRWWAQIEQTRRGKTRKVDMAFFRADRSSYAAMAAEARDQSRIEFTDIEQHIGCIGGGCGI